MTKQLTRVSIRSIIPISAAAFFVVGVIAVLFSILILLFVPGPVTSFTLSGPVRLDFAGVPPVYVLLIYPFLCAVAGAIYSALAALLYNVLARLVGPVRIDLVD